MNNKYNKEAVEKLIKKDKSISKKIKAVRELFLIPLINTSLNINS